MGSNLISKIITHINIHASGFNLARYIIRKLITSISSLIFKSPFQKFKLTVPPFLFSHRSGRQSLSKMATFIANYKLFQIEVIKGYNMRSWREDVKNVLMKAGVDQQPVTFLFVDTQIINE